MGHMFSHCSRERKATVLDHKGCNSNGTNGEGCLLMRLKHQPKQSLNRGTIFMRGCLSLCCPACSGTFLVTIQSLSVYTVSGAEWIVAQGSPWEAQEAPPHPALPSVSPSLPLYSIPTPPTTPPQHIVHSHTNTHWVMELPAPLSPTHTSTKAMGERLISLCFLSLADTEAFGGLGHSTIGAPSAVLKAELLHMHPANSCRFVKA